MGAEEQASGEASQMKPDGEIPAVPPPEEPPKMEEIVTPEVLKAVVDGYKSDAKLISFHAEPGTKIGDNYMSIMYKVDIELEAKGERETLPVMLKTIPRNVFRAEMINEMHAFKKEATIYQQVFPKMMQAQVERDVPREQQFSAWPICYASHIDGTTDFLAMENLRVAGYKMGSRMVGLDFNHCSLVLRNLARYHAISYAMFGGDREKIIEALPVLKLGMFNKESKVADMQAQWFKQSFTHESDQLKEMKEELASSRLKKLGEMDLMAILGDLTMNGVEHAVITHGDCWVNNMLFKYGDNDEKSSHPLAVKFIDFQISMASSRILDVYYFLMTSCMISVLNEREEDLLMTYYTEFTSTAQNLGVNTKERGLTWQNLQKEAKKYRLYGVILGLLLAPMLSADSADIPDMDSFTEEDMKNTDEAMAKFFKDLTKDTAMQKVKSLVLDHLPKCEGVEAYL